MVSDCCPFCNVCTVPEAHVRRFGQVTADSWILSFAHDVKLHRLTTHGCQHHHHRWPMHDREVGS